jgi:reversion-inducing-cysteine-rich protein with kazal motifs
MLFEKNSGTVRDKLEILHKKCNGNVIECVTKSVDVKYLSNYEDIIHCCNYGSSNECKSLCKNNLIYQNLTEKEIIDSLIPNCGVVNLSSNFWACFLNGKKQASMEVRDDVSQIKQIGIDAAKLHCCEKARSTTCRRQCFHTYNTGEQMTRSRNFNQDCLNNNHEIELKRCLDEVDFPAELGCNGLSFCSNFNNRPTELFRNCNPNSDRAAFNEYRFWRDQNILSLPGIDVPINNISFCSPNVWHAIACILQLRPTTSDQHMSQICWDDCFDILSKCLDWRRMTNSEMVPQTVCHKISPDSREPCVSVKFFLEPNEIPFEIENLKIVSPCRGHPCNSSSEICEVNRNIHKSTCTSGCPMGEGSSYIIPIGEYVKIPSSINKGCYKVCRCSENGRIEKCQLLPCVTPKACQIGNRTIEHGASINVECNMCSCFSEEITCTKKQCRMMGISENAFTTLPCNCPAHYVPVCGRNGKTYPSSCLAKCVGLTDADIEFGSCESKNPCDDNDCGEGSLCFPNKNVCLSNMSKPCPQYKCGK